MFHPYISMQLYDNVNGIAFLDDVNAQARNGDNYAFKILLNAESFNYFSLNEDAKGFKISLHHHR